METEEVRRIIEDWARAVRAGDLEGVMRHHAADFLFFDVIGPVRREGLEAYRKSWLEEFFPWHGGTGRFDLVDLKVSAGGEVAFATSLLECAGTEDGKKAAYTLRLTIGLEQREGRWLIVHEHHSQPVDFDVSRIGPGKTGR